MKLRPSFVLSLSLLSACIVPPSMFERASWGPPPGGSWEQDGRYRPGYGAQQAAPTAANGAEPSAQRADVPSSALAPSQEDTPRDPALTPGPAPAPEAPLYAWDGGIVDGAPQGEVRQDRSTPRGLETPPAGRMHIIELYQQVLDERDALSDEVALLRKQLEETSLALEARTKSGSELESRVAALEASHKELLEDNHAIAARLVTAQIRRLESEKLLLETRIEMERQKAEAAAQAAQQLKAGVPRGGAQRPKSDAKEAAGHDTGGGS
jgi:hypothetical protein